MKKYIVIAIVLLIAIGLIYGGIYLYKKDKCENEYEKRSKITFFLVKCVLECETISGDGFNLCRENCTEAYKTLEEAMSYDPSIKNPCSQQMEKLRRADPLDQEITHCIENGMRSIRLHLNDSSIPIENSCVKTIEQKHPELLIL